MEEEYSIESVKQEIKVNKFHLDVENEKHPSLCHYYEEMLADLKAEKDDAIKKLDFIKCEVELKIRTGGYKYEENIANNKELKLTEGTIKALVTTDKKVNEYTDSLNDIKKQIYHLEAITKSIEHRKSNLKNLTQLYATAYFSRPDDNIKKEDKDNIELRKMKRRRNKYE